MSIAVSAPPGAPVASPAVRQLRALLLATLLSLVVLNAAWELWLAPTGSGTLVVKVLPLVLCVAGVLRHRMYTVRWLSLLVWLYFAEGIVRATTEHGTARALAAADTALCVLLFVVSAAYIRLRLRNRPASTGDAPA